MKLYSRLNSKPYEVTITNEAARDEGLIVSNYRHLTVKINGSPELGRICHWTDVESERKSLIKSAQDFIDGCHHSSHYANFPELVR